MEDRILPLDLPRGGEALEPRSSIFHPLSSDHNSALRALRSREEDSPVGRMALPRGTGLRAELWFGTRRLTWQAVIS